MRISPEEELIGNDMCKHGGAAYPVDAVEESDREAVKNLEVIRALSDRGSLGDSLPGYESPRAGSTDMKGSTSNTST